VVEVISLLKRFRVWRRRRRLEKAYLRVAKAELDKRHGFTPIIRAWELMEREDYIEIKDGEKKWKWP
jgi:hypothetical protein